MLNADIRVRCISQQALKDILAILRDESNTIYVDAFHTEEMPRTGSRAVIIFSPDTLTRSRAKAGGNRRTSKRTAPTGGS